MPESEASQFADSEPPKKKRRSRVSRACDECRIRKIKCNGGQPCENCSAFERSCLYHSSRVQKAGGVQHVRALEDSLSRARNYIEELHEKVPPSSHRDIDSIFFSPTKLRSPSDPSHRSDSVDDGGGGFSPSLENMMDQQEQMTSADHKTASFYGDSSGFAFLQKTKQLFDDTQNISNDSDLSKSTQRAITRLFDSPLPDKQALQVDVPVSNLLPSRQAASELLHVVFGQVYPLLQFLDEATFQTRTDRIYDVEPMDFTDADHDFLPLLYAVLALGFVFSQKKHQQYGCGRAVTEGMRHFIAARQMMDVTNCRDIVSLQVLICFILFLMSTARLATSHTYTGLALTSAIRLGLHSQGPVNDSFSKEEQTERRRVFETIVKMDIYTSSVLGLPTLTDLPKLERTLLQDIDLDLEASRGHPGPPGKQDMAIIAAAKHLEVLLIIAKVINTLYPNRAGRQDKKDAKSTFFIRNADIMELETAFRVWRESLPEFLQPDDQSVTFQTISYELEMVHNFGHIVLYRPFLHYLAKSKTAQLSDQRQLRCALACVQIARRTVLKSAAMQQHGFLSAASWFSVYTIFLSIVTLVFYLAAQSNSHEAADLQQAAEAGVRILAGSECQDIGSKRCLEVLRVLIKRLSHVINLDIDQICENTPSLCQSEYPNEPRPIQQSLGNPGASGVENPIHKNFNFDWINANQSGAPQQFGDMSWQTAASQTYVDSNTLSAYLDLNRSYRYDSPNTQQRDSSHVSSGHLQSSTSGYTPNTGIQSSDAVSFQSGIPAYPTSQSDNMEIPYAESFAWPFQTSSGNQGLRDSNLPGQHFEMYSEHQPLTSEDIAAFMRINPGEHPFL